MSSHTDMLMTHFTHSLSTPIPTRCANLTVLIDSHSSKDLQSLFPTLLENIFGTSGGLGWGLRNITPTNNPKDFEILHHFLGPLGPIFRLIYKLLTDCQVKYEFSCAHLPNKIRYTLDHSKIPPFYGDLVNIDSQTRKCSTLSLNAFDYYIFHFAYHLTNPWQQRQRQTWNIWHTVYYVLCCDYMIHFLPFDPNTIVTPQLKHFTGKNPIVVTPQSVNNRRQRTSKLLRGHVMQQVESDISALQQTMQQHPRGEIWRSETIVQVFIDMWLNNDQLTNVDTTFNPQSKVNELPSGEYIRILRVLVKQLHAFSASGKNDTTPLGELKKIVQPMLQGRMYAFLRYLVYRWPLDGSFRLVLELWLSFIQPWRYTAESFGKNIRETPDFEEKDVKPVSHSTRIVDPEYIGFIAENLLAYTVIFQQLLTRFSRVDLASPKNSLMLFRVTKVFAQPNLIPMIQEIESCIDLNNSPNHSFNNSLSLLPPLSPSWHAQFDLSSKSLNTSLSSPSLDGSRKFQNSKWAAIVRHRIFEWEGPEFCYKPMFIGNVNEDVILLLRCIQVAENVATETVRVRSEEQKIHNVGFSGFLRSLFYVEESSDEFSLEERKKVECYLNFAKQNLLEIYKLNPTNLKPVEPSLEDSFNMSTHSLNVSASTSNPILDFSPAGAKIRVKTLKYQGDPDLHPIRSNENAFLVRVLYHFAQKINTMYSEQIQNAYNRPDVFGKIAKTVLCPPIITYSYDKSIPGLSPRVQKLLPPRVSFRYFANHHFLAYLFIMILLSKFFGYSPVFILLIVILFWLLYITVKSFFVKTNVALNDSFNDMSF